MASIVKYFVKISVNPTPDMLKAIYMSPTTEARLRLDEKVMPPADIYPDTDVNLEGSFRRYVTHGRWLATQGSHVMARTQVIWTWEWSD